MSENEIIDSGIELPRLAFVEPLMPFTLRVGWAEGPRTRNEEVIDLHPAIFGFKVYKPLRDESLFLTGHIAEDGDAVSWNGKDLVMSADMIQSLAEQAMSPSDFSLFLSRHSFTQEAAAAFLG